MIKSDSIDQVSAALTKAQSEMGNASKGSANPFFKSKYADLNSIREACMPALTNHKLSVLQPMVVVDGKNYIETVIVHESGQFIGGLTEVIFSKANDAQNFGAGTTYARRFGLQSLLCIGAEDDDGESAIGRSSKSTYTKSAQTIEVSSSPHKVETTATIPTKSGGFGVKKSEVKPKVEESTEEGWE
jgi:hypothetical protein